MARPRALVVCSGLRGSVVVRERSRPALSGGVEPQAIRGACADRVCLRGMEARQPGSLGTPESVNKGLQRCGRDADGPADVDVFQLPEAAELSDHAGRDCQDRGCLGV